MKKRFGAAFLVRIGQLETQLFDACLGPEEEPAAAAAPAVGASAAGNGAGDDETTGVSATEAVNEGTFRGSLVM